MRSPMVRFTRLLAVAAALLVPFAISAAPFTPGNIVVYRVGTGAAALNGNATAVFLDEYTTAGVFVQTIALPAADAGANQTLTSSGTAAAEGLMTRSADGRFLVMVGYDAAPGTASVTTSNSTTINRIFGRVDFNGVVDTSTATTTFNGSAPRGATSVDGTAFWGSGGNTGVVYVPFGTSTVTVVSNTVTNLRSINIAGPQLFVSSMSGTFRLATVGTGTPSTSGQTTTNLPGFPTSGTSSPYQYAVLDIDNAVPGLDTVYVADDRAVASGGGVQKWTFDGTTWTQRGTLSTGLSSGLRGLIAVASGTNVTIYATDAATASRLVTATDTSGVAANINGTFSTLLTAATNTAFRSVAFAPVAPPPPAPTVVSIVRANATPTNDASVDWTVTFSESVTGVDTGDFTIAPVGVTGAAVSNVSGSGTTYTVTATTGTGDGQIRLDLIDNDSIVNGSAVPLGGPGAQNFTTGEVYGIDKSAPAVASIVRAGANPAGGPNVGFTVTFNEPVGGIDVTDFALTTTGAVSGASVNSVLGSGTTYTVDVLTGSGSGTIRLDFVDNDTVIDAAGNPTAAGFTGGEVYTIDKTAPVPTITRADADPTAAASVDFDVVFNEPVVNLGTADFTLTTTGVSGASITGITGSGASYTVSVNTGSGNGTIRLDIDNAATFSDSLGNAFTGGYTGGEIYTVDKANPAVISINRANPNPTTATTLNWTVTFSQVVTGVDMSDFALAPTGVTGASLTNVTGSGTTYTVTATHTGGTGTLGLNLVDDNSITNGGATPLGGSGAGDGNFTGQLYDVDNTAPSASSIVRAEPNPNPGPAVDFTVTFSESVTGVGTSDFALTVTGLGGASIDSISGSGSTYTVTVLTGPGTGTIRLDLVDDDTIFDLAGNPLTGGFTGGETYDIAPPPPPTNLVAAAGDAKVSLTWTAAPGATMYNVKRSTTPGGPYTPVVTNHPATSYLDTTVVNGTQYFYVVTAANPPESVPSNESSATPNTPPALGVVLSQIYGAGGNASATLNNDLIEIFNRGSSNVDLSGWSVQYASAGGTSWQTTPLGGVIPPGRYRLINEAAGTSCSGSPCGVANPNGDFTGSINMSGTAGKIALVASAGALSGACPTSASIADLIGYGSGVSCSETAAAPAPSNNTTALFRNNNGCTDTNNNSADFANAPVAPRNSLTPLSSCGFSAIGSANPPSVPVGGSTLLTVQVTPASAPPSTGIVVTADLTPIGGSASQAFTSDAPGTWTYNATVGAVPAGPKTLTVTVTDDQARGTSTTINVTVTPSLEPISAVRIDDNVDTIPDRVGQSVLVRGIVTSTNFRGTNGIEQYIQDTTGGIVLFNSTGTFNFPVGTNVEVSGTLAFFNGLTEITSPTVTTLPAGTLPNSILTPAVVTLAQLIDGAGEPLEGELVRIDNLTVTSGTFPAAGASGNVTVSDGVSSGTIRIDADTDIDGTTAPGGVFSIIGVVGQSDATAPHDCCYQLFPRTLADIIPRTSPTGSGAANPPSVAPGGTSLLTVTVTPGQNPPSTSITVVVNLSTIGGSATQAFLDDGNGGDASPGDGIYSYNATVDNATTLGAKSFPVTISDAQSRSSATTINLFVQSASAPPVPLNLVATPGNAQVTLTWDTSAGATGYNIKRSTTAGGPYTTIVPNHATTTYLDTAVVNGTRYYYVVSALSGANESGNSSEASALPSAPPPSGPLARIVFVDIGQGAATLIISPTGKTLLVDGGPTGRGAKVAQVLDSLGIATIDYTVLTHYHIDHEDGIKELIAAGRVAGIAYDNGDGANVVPPNAGGTLNAYNAYKAAIAANPQVTRQTITPGTVIDLGGGMRATCLVAAGNFLSGGSTYMSTTDLNSESISMFVEFNDFDFVVSGDLTGGGSTSTAKTPDIETFAGQLARDVDVFQLDHHGSTTANNRRFMGTLRAEMAIASAGYTNTFGHPNREPVNKYLNTPVTSGNTFGGEGVPNPGTGPVFYQTDPSPAGDSRVTQQGHSGASPANAGNGSILLKTDGTVSFTLESLEDAGARLSPAQHVYAIDGANAGITTNFPPTVVPSIAPEVPLATDVVTVSAQVADKEDPIASVTLEYSLNGSVQAPATMTLTGPVYTTTIPAQPDGTRVDYTVVAVAGGQTTRYANGYFAGTTSVATIRSLDALGEPRYLEYPARVSGVALSGTGNFSSGNNDDYLSDGTAALNIWRTIQPSTPAPQPTTTGNTYTVAGLIGGLAGRFRLEVTPPFDSPTTPFTIVQTAAGGAPAPTVRTIAQINAALESFEGHLLQINNATVTSGTIPGSPAASDGFLTISDGTGSMQMKIDRDSDIPGLATPSGTFVAIGILTQEDPLRPFDTAYAITPRNRVDLGAAPGGPALMTIAEAREDVDASTELPPGDYIPDRLNQTVRVQGTITSIDYRGGNGIEFTIQDATGGVMIFNTTVNPANAIGSSIEVIGSIVQFNGLTEINPGTTISNVTSLPAGTTPAITPQVVTLSQLASAGVGESLEGLLVRVNNVTVTAGTYPATGADANLTITDATGSATMRIDRDTDIDGWATPPSGSFSLIGIVSQFDNAAPFDCCYQILPRMQADFLPAVVPPASITATAGTPQQTEVNTQFPTAMQARVLDASSNPIAGVSVTFTAPASGASGTFSGSATVTTDSNGVATAPAFTANGTAGSYNVTATINSLTANFALTNLAATPASITAIAGTPQQTQVNTQFPTAMQARVLDGSSNPMAGVSVTFTAPASGASGTFSASATVTTDSNGVATAPAFTANGTTGSYNVTATVNSLTANFALTNLAATPASITAIAGTPQQTQVNTQFPTAMQARVLDASSNPIAGVSVTFTAPASGASGTFSGSATVTTDSNGVATAPAFTANGTAGSYNVTATVNALTANFALTNLAATPASITAIAGTPQQTQVNTQFPTAMQARVLDGSSNPIAGVSVTFTAPASGASGTFSASATVTTNSNGVATAPAFTANGTAGSYNVTATINALTANFALTNLAPPPVQLGITAPASVTAGVPFNVTVTAPASYGGTISFSSSSAGTLPGPFTFTPPHGGSQTFQVTLTTVGSQSVTVSGTNALDATANLNVVAACTMPSVTMPTSTLRACAGSTAGISFNLAGAPPFTVTWSDGTSQTITTNAGTRGVAADASRTYTITSVANACGTVNVSVSTQLNVDPLPTITEQPAGATIAPGKTATLKIGATGGPFLTVEWYRGPVGDQQHYVGTGREIQTNPLGTTTHFWAKVYNNCGLVQSAPVTITVVPPRRRNVGGF